MIVIIGDPLHLLTHHLNRGRLLLQHVGHGGALVHKIQAFFRVVLYGPFVWSHLVRIYPTVLVGDLSLPRCVWVLVCFFAGIMSCEDGGVYIGSGLLLECRLF